MTEKTRMVDFLGEQALVLPALLSAALAANDRAKYVLTLLQLAASQADNPQASAPTMRKEREACGIDEASFDRAIARAERDPSSSYHIPGAQRLLAMLDDAVRAMIAPLGAAERIAPDSRALQAGFRERFEKLLRSRSVIVADTIGGETIAELTSGRAEAGGLHVLIMELHREINRLQAAISTTTVAGAKAYGLGESDRDTLGAFMAGVQRTASLKFDHPGLDAVATRADDTLLIQNDLGTTEAHVLVLKIRGLRVVLIHTDIHLPRLRFLQSLCAGTGIHWEDIRSRQDTKLGEDGLFYLAFGEFVAPDTAALHTFLERLGSRLVFLIDWNKARKRLGLLVPNETAVEILRWGADHDVGHRAFLKLGGERLIYDALEQAVRTPLRYGEPLHQMIGTEVAQEYLQFVLHITASALLHGQSEALIRDRVRAELFTHFRSAEQRFLAACSRHAEIVCQLAGGFRAALRLEGAARGEALIRHADRAKLWETRADDEVKELRATVRRVAGTDIFCRIVETADDAADHLEDAAFLARLLFERAPPERLPEPLLVLADLLNDGTQAFRQTMESAQYVRRGGDREAAQRFLEAADRVVVAEHQTDERQRAVTAILMEAPIDSRQLYLLAAVADHLESAADALMHASFQLRDHVLGEVMLT